MSVLMLLALACAPVEDVDGGGDVVPSDEDCTLRVYFADLDGDGVGRARAAESRCVGGPGWSERAGDCDDRDPAVNPDAVEVCNGYDDDCDGVADVVPTWFLDLDGDGFGDPSTEVRSCDVDPAATDVAGDCDDGDEDVHPDAREVCNGVDDDCDGQADEDAGRTWCADFDADGYGDEGVAVVACDAPDRFVADCSDCDDQRAATYPGAWDGCDGEDNDCDGEIDEAHKAGWSLVGGGSGAFFEVDPRTAEVSEMSGFHESLEITGLDVSEEGDAILSDDLDGRVMDFDACSGVTRQVAHAPLQRTGGVSFGPGHDLFLIDQERDTLIRVDPHTGASSILGGLGEDFGANAMAYDCATNVVLALNASNGWLYELSTHDGLATPILDTGLAFEAVGLEYDASRSMLWASTGRDLWEIELSGGTANYVGRFEVPIGDLALYPSCDP